MSTEALTCGSHGLAIHARLHVPPVHIQSVLTSFSHLVLVLFELFLRHHLSIISIANNLLILNIGLHMLGCVATEV